MEDIYVNYTEFDRVEDELRECSAAIKSDNAKLNQYAEEISRYWTGTASNAFRSKLEDIIEYFQRIQNEVEDDANTVKSSKNVYQKFEAYFLSKNI